MKGIIGGVGVSNGRLKFYREEYLDNKIGDRLMKSGKIYKLFSAAKDFLMESDGLEYPVVNAGIRIYVDPLEENGKFLCDYYEIKGFVEVEIPEYAILYCIEDYDNLIEAAIEGIKHQLQREFNIYSL